MNNETKIATRRGRAFWLALLVAAPLYLFGTFNHDVWRPADAREAGIAREMIETGHWSATHLNGRIFLEKPPLYTWLLAAPMLVFGYREWAMRIFVFLFTMGSLAMTYQLARCVLSERGAQGALLALATMWLFVEVNHGAMIDNGLVFFMLVAMLAFWRALATDPPGLGYTLLFYLALGLVFLCKGAVGLVLIGGALCGYLATTREWRRIWGLRPWWGTLIFGLLAGGWLWALWLAGGSEYFRIFFVENHLQRFLGTYEPTKVRWYYFYYLPIIALPWTLLLPAGMTDLWVRGRTEPAVRRFMIFLFWWIGAMFAILSVAGSKGNQYLMPILPPMAVFAGAWVERSIKADRLAAWEIWLARIFVAAVVLLGVALPLVPLWFDRFGLAVSLILAAGMAGAAGVAGRAMRGGRWAAVWRSLACMAVLGGITLGWSIEGVMNRHKSMRQLSVLLAEHVPEGDELWGYELNENTLGALIFYGYQPRPLPELRMAREMADGPALVLWVSGNRRDTAEDHLCLLAGWDLVFHERIGGRHCRLYRRSGPVRGRSAG